MTTLQEYLDKEYKQAKEISIVTTSDDGFYSNLSFTQEQIKELEGGELNLSEYPNLEKVWIWGNKLKSPLTKLELGKNPKLIDLRCPNNKLTNLNVTNLPNLKILHCFRNKLISLNLTNNHKLEWLSTGDNNFPEQDSSWLSHLVNLKELKLQNNSFTGSLELLKNMKELKFLNTGGNNFSGDLTFFQHLVNLEELYLWGNKIYGSLKSLQNLTKLSKLNIDNTDIDSGLEYLPESVKGFYCSANIKKDAKVKVLEQELRKHDEATKDSDGDNFIIPLRKWRKERQEKKQEKERRLITSLIPTERLFVIRGNIKQFINKWSKSHENDWYEWLKKNPFKSTKTTNEITELQSPKEAKLDKGIIVGYRVLNNGLATSGIVLSFQGKSDIGAGLLGVYPINEFFITYLEKSLDKRESKWKEFLDSADTFSDNFNELLGIIRKIDEGSELGKTQTVKNLKKRMEKLLEIYDENEKDEEGHGEIDLEELINKKEKLAQDLDKDKKAESKWWGIIDSIRKLEDLVINYQKNGSLDEELVDNSEKDNSQNENHHTVNVETEKIAQILQKETYPTPSSSKN